MSGVVAGQALLIAIIGCAGVNLAAAELPPARGSTLVGLEYAVVDNDRLTAGMAKTFGALGITSMKLLGEASQWGRMQKGPNRNIDFSGTDRFVREYQRHGVQELIMALKSHSKWASTRAGLLTVTDPTPKPQFLVHYRNWIKAVVERYDGDGVDDMPGLQRPVRYFEVGSEFSSYEPEPVAAYLSMLEAAYKAAKAASAESIVTHAAFLTTPVDLDVHTYDQLESRWANTKMHDRHHGIRDIRAVLDRPDLFDVVNVHNLGDPYEIEHIMRWLAWEMGQRRYSKRVIISDTIPTAYIAWGSATRCHGKNLGTIIPPATEAERCRLAKYFERLVDKDPDTLRATREFIAIDHVKRTIVAYEQRVAMINLSFTFDLPLLTHKFAQAGAGISAWGGAAEFVMHSGTVKQHHPLYFALRQLIPKLVAATEIRRLPLTDPSLRLYEIVAAAKPTWIAWRDTGPIFIPGDPIDVQTITLPLPAEKVAQIEIATTKNVPPVSIVKSTHGILKLPLGSKPVYLIAR